MLGWLSSAGAGTPAVVALRDLPVPHVLTAADVEVREVPLLFPEDAGFGTVDEVLHHTVRYPILAGEPVRARRLSDEGAGLGGVVPHGTRAIRLPVTPGFAVYGDYVDLFASEDGVTEQVWSAAAVLIAHPDGLTVAVPSAAVPRLLHDPASLEAALRNPGKIEGPPPQGFPKMQVPAGTGLQVWVAAAPLSRGHPIREMDLMQVPLSTPEDVAPTAWLDRDALMGKVVAGIVFEGEPLRIEHLASPQSSASLPAWHLAVGTTVLPSDAIEGHIQELREAL